jgi:glycerol-3-phosphate acyltransferase PlsY
VLGIQPFWALIALVVFVAVAVTSRWMALASLAAAVTLPVVAVIMGASRPQLAWALVLAAIVIFRHRVNIVMAWRRRHEPIRWRRPQPPHSND